jgi:GGDEF domain-containing protein
MATRIDMAGITATAPVSAALPVAALGDPAQESLRRLTSLETGKAFQAEVLSRLSNGDFVVGIAEVIHVAERIVEAMSTQFVLGDAGRCMAQASVCISLYPQDGVDVPTLLRRADLAMYWAKSGGKGQYAFYRKELDCGDQPAAG